MVCSDWGHWDKLEKVDTVQDILVAVVVGLHFELDFFLLFYFQVCTVQRSGGSQYLADFCSVAMVSGFLVDLAAVEMLEGACSHFALWFEAAPYLRTQGDKVMEVVAYQVI